MAVDPEHFKMLVAYPKVANFLLRTYAVDEIVDEAHFDAVIYRQGSNMTEES